MINWTTTKEETFLVRDLGLRAVKLIGCDFQEVMMDIAACHLNGTPLNLVDLLSAENSDFIHDIMGINHHIDRETGKLMNCFLPRFSK